jgi:hypothetical protein
MKSFQLFAALCGQKKTPNIVIATTMWGDINEKTGIRRETELKNTFWADMVADGCSVERFHDTAESAWRIVDRLPRKIAERLGHEHTSVSGKQILQEDRVVV